jgi:hypothetical protein
VAFSILEFYCSGMLLQPYKTMELGTFLVMKNWKKTAYEVVVVRSWWMWVVIVFCYLFYSHGIRKKNEQQADLQARLTGLESMQLLALQEREDLLLQINSQSDPDWIELTLKKGLGVVPEGQVKVYFKKEE